MLYLAWKMRRLEFLKGAAGVVSRGIASLTDAIGEASVTVLKSAAIRAAFLYCMGCVPLLPPPTPISVHVPFVAHG